jgi:hypothetical protein
MARRDVHVFGPATAFAFAEWAGISLKAGETTFERLRPELVAVSTPIGEAWLLAADEHLARADHPPTNAVRLLPSGDTFFLLWASNRELLVPDEKRRQELWTTRVWPGALLVGGEIVGVWRRANEKVAIDLWRPLSATETASVEEEAASLPLPLGGKGIRVSWATLPE